MSTFVNCINRINNTQVDNAQDVDAVIVTYFPSRFHLIHFLYQSLSIQFMYRSPTHSSSYSFLSHSFYKSYSISFTFATFCFAHTASYSSFIVSLTFEKILIWNIYCIIWSWTPTVLLFLYKNHNSNAYV